MTKKKGKGKGKDNSKGEDKAINLMRFAYDIFRYSALRFQVPSQTIAAWEGSENDYGCPDLISVVSRSIFVHQINMRYQLNLYFKCRLEPRTRNSLEHIGELFGDVIKRVTTDEDLSIITHVEFSLATVCELILFLYSENYNLFLVQLAELWFRCYLKPIKAKFKKKGALEELYRKGKKTQKELPDALLNIFIDLYCTNYRNSAQLENLAVKYFESVSVYKQKNIEKYCTEESEDPAFDVDLPHYIYPAVEFPLTSVLDEDSGVNLPPNPLLGVTLPSEMYDFPLAGDAPLSQNLPEESFQELSKRTKRPSYQDRMRNRRHGSGSSVEQGHGQLSSDSSLATGSRQSHERQGAIPKGKNPGSSGLQTGKSSSRPSMEQGHGQASSDSSIATGSRQSYEDQGAIPKGQNPGSSGLQTGKSSSRPSVEQGHGQVSSDSSIATDTTQSQNYPDKICQVPTKEHSGSSSEGETEKKEIQE